MKEIRWGFGRLLALLIVLGLTWLPPVFAQGAPSGKKPNILVIWGDDIGTTNISFNNRGLMGYRTPNIDRIARKACRSRTITANRVARPAAPPSSAETIRCGPA